jgi:hypothetical protein
VGRISQHTFIDTYSKVAFAKLYDTTTPLTAADLLNDADLPGQRAARDGEDDCGMSGSGQRT